MAGTALRRAEEEQRICLHGLVTATETMAMGLVALTDWFSAQRERERQEYLGWMDEMARAGATARRICRQMIADSTARERALRPRAKGKQPGQIALVE